MRYIEEGESPLEAALKGSEEIGFTIVSLSVSLIAVLIPLLFMGDIVGRLFREFAVTLSVTILVSAIVSLTLTPMMCAKLLQAHAPRRSTAGCIARRNAAFEPVIRLYGQTLRWRAAASGADAAGRRGHAGGHGLSLRRSCPRDFSRCRTRA